MAKQNRLFRIVWKLLQEKKFIQSQLNTYLQITYQIDKRTANTLIQTAKGRLKALKELKVFERANRITKMTAVERQIGKYKADLEELKEKVMENSATEKQLFLYIRTTVLSSQESIDPEHTGKMCAVYFSICSMVSMRKEGDLKEISQTNRDVEQMCTLNH